MVDRSILQLNVHLSTLNADIATEHMQGLHSQQTSSLKSGVIGKPEQLVQGHTGHGTERLTSCAQNPSVLRTLHMTQHCSSQTRVVRNAGVAITS